LFEHYKKHKEPIDRFLFIIAAVVFLFVFFKYLFSYFSPFVYGFLLSLIVIRPVDFLNKKLALNRGFSVLLMLVSVFGLLILGGTLIVTKLYREMDAFSARLPEYTGIVQNWFDGVTRTLDGYMLALPEFINISADDVINHISLIISDYLSAAVTQLSINMVSVIPHIIIVLVISIISAFFFAKDMDGIKQGVGDALPAWLADKLTSLKRGFSHAIGGYFKAQFIIMSVITAICILGLTLAGSPYAILIGLLLGVLDFLPVVGTGTVLLPWALIALIQREPRFAVILLITYGVCFVVRQVIEPKIVGEHIGVHPILTLMSIFIGLQLLGPVGFILGPIFAVFIKVVIEKSIEG
jgi:sporulation integral membrane protein YtvI